jgi:hypothetical protein
MFGTPSPRVAIMRSRECTECGVPIGPELYGDCARCNFAVLCELCASHHFCSPGTCPDFGCVPGQCIRLVEGGEFPSRRLGPKAATERWG